MDAVTGQATAWNPNANGGVNALVVDGGTVYAGGGFNIIGGQPRNRIAALDATTGLATAWNPGANSSVWALAVSGSTVFAGGQFSAIGTLERHHLAAITDTTLVVDVPAASFRPGRVTLGPVRPHPLRQRAWLRLDLPGDERVTLSVYDTAGRRVATILDRAALPAGRHDVPIERGSLATGICFVRLEAGDCTASAKLVVLAE